MANMKRRAVRDPGFGRPVHPGEWLFRAFMQEYSVSQNALARAMGVSPRRVNEIVNGERRISGETALLLEDATGIAAWQWMTLQAEYELATARQAMLARPPRPSRPLRPLEETHEYSLETLARVDARNRQSQGPQEGIDSLEGQEWLDALEALEASEAGDAGNAGEALESSEPAVARGGGGQIRV
jgi:addiction module HigA family antidote